MNEFTKRLIDEDLKRRENPDDYRVILVCPTCHESRLFEASAQTVKEFRERNNGSNRMESPCELHSFESEREEE